MRKSLINPRDLRHGFSLVELLVVIAVIAVVAAIAVPGVTFITAAAYEASKLRNSQEVAFVWNSYVEAHYAAYQDYPAADGVEEIITSLNGGLDVENTRLSTTSTFRLRGLTVDDVNVAILTFDGLRLVYNSN